jgi:DNA repair protein RecN (Recombination protein N)
MIEELRIRSLGVIEEAVVPFAPGLTVLTGETGAGKTMVLTGLALIRGGKADPGIVRAGAERADVDAVWRVGEDDVLRARLEEAGAGPEPDGGDLLVLLGRSVSSAGRSRAFACGRSVPASVLGEVSDRLVAVHGQSDQLLLRDARRQRDLLDRFGGPELAAIRAAYGSAFEAWRGAVRELADLVEHRQERERAAALMRLGIEEIEAVQPEPGEDEALAAQSAVLAHAGDLLADVGRAHALLEGGGLDEADTAVADLLLQAGRALGRAAELDPQAAALAERLEVLTASAQDLAADLARYAASIDADPERQQAVEERRHAIGTLKRKYGPELADVLQWWSTAAATVAVVDGADDRIAALTDEVTHLRGEVRAAAARLSDLRLAAAAEFSAAVTDELRALAMPDASVTVEVATEGEPERFTADGADTVTMLLSPHAGSGPRPLGQGASGGELSRVMLAVEVVLAGVHGVPTFVFDEVDAGIGGRVGVEVGRRLARLARSAQVVVVTHLPQVAAFADQHVVVTKDRSGQVTAASVTVVEGDDRVRELVRMLSGLEDSASGAEHAAELLALAESDRGKR